MSRPRYPVSCSLDAKGVLVKHLGRLYWHNHCNITFQGLV